MDHYTTSSQFLQSLVNAFKAIPKAQALTTADLPALLEQPSTLLLRKLPSGHRPTDEEAAQIRAFLQLAASQPELTRRLPVNEFRLTETGAVAMAEGRASQA
jgi:hypothetical protein